MVKVIPANRKVSSKCGTASAVYLSKLLLLWAAITGTILMPSTETMMRNFAIKSLKLSSMGSERLYFHLDKPSPSTHAPRCPFHLTEAYCDGPHKRNNDVLT